MVSESSEDRRRSRRISYPCDARCYGIGESLSDPHLEDVSVTGAFIKTTTELPEGAIVLLRFEAGGRRIKAEAEVVHHLPNRGLGVRFLNLGTAQRKTIAGLGGEPPG